MDTDGTITTHYVIDKSRVAPIKPISIPKLELEAAALGAELSMFRRSEMSLQFLKISFWSDSTAALGWLPIKSRQKIYIANRIAKIKERTSPEQ